MESVSVTSKLHYMSVHVERPWSKKMKIISYFYQDAANSYSASNIVTIRIWWAMIFYSSMQFYIPFTFRFELFIGRRGKKEILQIYQGHCTQNNDGILFKIKMFKSVTVMWYKNYDLFSCRNESKQTLYQQTSNRIHKKV